MKRICFSIISVFLLSSCGNLLDKPKLTDHLNTDSVNNNKKLTDKDQLKDWVDRLKRDWGADIKVKSRGNYSLDVPFKKTKDNIIRRQWVYISIGKNVAKTEDGDQDEDIYDIHSQCSELNNIHLDQLDVLQEAQYGFYSMICIRKQVSESDEEPKSAVYVQSGPLLKHCNSYDMFKFIVFEVASNADYLEEKYNKGKDKY